MGCSRHKWPGPTDRRSPARETWSSACARRAIPITARENGVWTIRVDVPFNAPPGDFQFDVKTYDESGEEVLVLDAEGNTVPLSAMFGLVISFPETP